MRKNGCLLEVSTLDKELAAIKECWEWRWPFQGGHTTGYSISKGQPPNHVHTCNMYIHVTVYRKTIMHTKCWKIILCQQNEPSQDSRVFWVYWEYIAGLLGSSTRVGSLIPQEQGQGSHHGEEDRGEEEEGKIVHRQEEKAEKWREREEWPKCLWMILGETSGGEEAESQNWKIQGKEQRMPIMDWGMLGDAWRSSLFWYVRYAPQPLGQGLKPNTAKEKKKKAMILKESNMGKYMESFGRSKGKGNKISLY